MIRKSFLILDKVSSKKEKNIWAQDIWNWDEFINTDSILGVSNKSKLYYDRQLLHAKKELYSFNSGYFSSIVPQIETWRLYNFFKTDAVYLDIEVTGVTNKDDITVIGLFDGINTKVMIKGVNMDLNMLASELKQYKLIITYNGVVFDIPFIKKRYPNLIPNAPVIDLRPLCTRIGLSGGLKMIEKQLGITRNKIIEKIYGGDPKLLWRMYHGSGNFYYLNLLVEYNEEDVINLKKISEHVIGKIEKEYNQYFKP